MKRYYLNGKRMIPAEIFKYGVKESEKFATILSEGHNRDEAMKLLKEWRKEQGVEFR